MTAMNLNRAIRGPVTAVPVVAGKGVRIVPDTVNNRFVVEADETVLFDSGSNDGASSGELSEAYTNFERLLFEVGAYNQNSVGQDGYQWCICSNRSAYTWVNFMYGQGGTNHYYATAKIQWTDSTHFTVTNASAIMHTETSTGVVGNTSNNNATKNCVIKIIGINRIANP